MCGYQGKNLIAQGKSNRLEKFLEYEEEQEDFLANVDYRLKEILSSIQDITGKVIFVFDCISTKPFRHNIYSEYKKGREKHRFAYNYTEFKKCIVRYKEFLETNGFITLEADELEADDIIGELCRLSVVKKKNSMILSPDGDMKQTLRSSSDYNIIMFDSNKKIIIVSDDFKLSNVIGSGWGDMGGIFDDNIDNSKISQFFKYYEKINPKKSLLTKIISGDTSDNIKSCINYTRGTSTFGVTEDRMKKFWENYTGVIDERVLSWEFIENVLLVDLNESLKTKKISQVFPNPENFREKFMLNSMLIEIGHVALTDDKRKLIEDIVDITTHKSTKKNFSNIEMFSKTDKNWLDDIKN
jgi:5'-3' exonuclease